MPIYEYRRPDGTTFDVMQKFSDPALTEDPETGVPVQKVLHAPAIHFKGSGFHNTDYGTKRRNRELEKAGSGGSDSDSGSSSSEGSSSSSESSSSASSEGSSSSEPKAKPADASSSSAKPDKAA